MPKRVAGPWVVYRVIVKGRPEGANAVCESGEWDTMEAARPGLHTLVQSGIGTENEAERLARGTSGDPTPRGGGRVKSRVPFGAAATVPAGGAGPGFGPGR